MTLALEQLLPQHLCSKLMGRLAHARNPFIKNLLIKRFISLYGVDINAAERNLVSEYEHFNDFFTRKLKDGARPITSGDTDIISPVDGRISEFGNIHRRRLYQAKNVDYSLKELLAEREDLTSLFDEGFFMTFYLSPRDYHRVHMPLDGTLRETIYQPGRLLSVKRRNTEKVPGLYSANERLICHFATDIGPVVIIFVGAIFVGSISTKWAGTITPPYNHKLQTREYAKEGPHSFQAKRGEEIGHFNMGSTVIMLLPTQKFAWKETLEPHNTVRMGECMLRYKLPQGAVI